MLTDLFSIMNYFNFKSAHHSRDRGTSLTYSILLLILYTGISFLMPLTEYELLIAGAFLSSWLGFLFADSERFTALLFVMLGFGLSFFAKNLLFVNFSWLPGSVLILICALQSFFIAQFLIKRPSVRNFKNNLKFIYNLTTLTLVIPLFVWFCFKFLLTDTGLTSLFYRPQSQAMVAIFLIFPAVFSSFMAEHFHSRAQSDRQTLPHLFVIFIFSSLFLLSQANGIIHLTYWSFYIWIGFYSHNNRFQWILGGIIMLYVGLFFLFMDLNPRWIPILLTSGIILNYCCLFIQIHPRKESTLEKVQPRFSALSISPNHTVSKNNFIQDRFFMILSHDLRSPLNSLRGYVDVIAEDDEISEAEKRATLRKIRNQIDSSLGLLDDILNWSGSQLTSLKLQKTDFALNELLPEILKLYHPMAKAKGIHLDVALPQKLFVRADKNMTKCVMRNLINNAIKYTPNFGQVSIRGEIKNGEIHFWVQDTGVGIDPHEIPHIFDPQQRQSKRGTGNEKGNGLGLFISKSLIESNQGKIWVESVEQQGSSFFFTLPQSLQNRSKALPLLLDEQTKMLPPLLL